MVTERYYVTPEGSLKRPYVVRDGKGGWMCSAHSTRALAQKRADELNAKEPVGPARTADDVNGRAKP